MQGIWNESLRPPWDSKYTCNINTEMNYWPALTTNLAECQEPLVDAINELAVSGQSVAKAHYGARGWVVHHNFDLWRGAAPINASNHGIWVVGGAWLCEHLWQQYLFTGDKEFLAQRAYPAMKAASEFFLDYLVKDPLTGYLISGPSNSPEQGGLVMGPTMDHAIIRSLLGNTAAAARELGCDAEFAAKLDEVRKRIAPHQVGRYGQLQEWLEDKDDPKNNAPPRLAPVGRLSRGRHHLARRTPSPPGEGQGERVGALRRRPAVAHLSRRRGHRLEHGLEGQPLGPLPRRRPRLPDLEQSLAADRLGQGARRLVSEPVRRPSALPDRRQFRGRGRHRRDAPAEPRRRGPLAARAAQGLARRQRSAACGPAAVSRWTSPGNPAG